MKQALRILVIYLAIIGLAYALLFMIPFRFNPQTLNLNNPKDIIVNEQDSSEIISLLEKDTLKNLLTDTTTIQLIPKDTIIVSEHLSCPTTFLLQLKELNHRLSQVHQNKEVVRILHFGDSQIEGDRITAYLREAFQNRYGGSGPGLNCILDPHRINRSVWLDNGDNWQLYSIYDRNRDKNRNTYGLLGQYAFLKSEEVGEFKLSKSPWAEPHAKNYQSIRLFIAPHKGSININGSIKNSEVINDSLSPSTNMTEINWSFPHVSPSLALKIKSTDDIAVLGVALDSISGVAVDNIALRGQSSPLLHRTNADLFKAMSEHLNIGMIILQYGTNMIPIETSNYSFYKKILSKQFDILSKLIPNKPILFIGIGDAAKSFDGKTESYHHLQELRDAQKELALEYGFAYFDLYEAMGGEGSIIKWTQTSPPLALTDYIHFSRAGGAKAADYIMDALWKQVDQFKYPIKGIKQTTDSLQVWSN
nr:hypothetical protein [uncultured Carboxylicivirga sp.]